MSNHAGDDRLSRLIGDYTRGNMLAFVLAVLLAFIATTSNTGYNNSGIGNAAMLLCVVLAVALFPPVYRKIPGQRRLYLALFALIAVATQLVSPGAESSSASSTADTASPFGASKGDVKHCFGTFSGTIDALRDQVKGSLNDPNSFELVSTEPDQALDRNITMTFRTKNQFNATVLASVDAQVNPDTCVVETVDQPKVDGN